MARPILYPEANELIRNKTKKRKLDEQEGNQEENSAGTSTKRKGCRVKNLPEEKREKALARKKRKIESSPSTSAPVLCKSCEQTGHNSTRSHDCPNHEFTLAERLDRDFSNSYHRYTVSLPLNSFLTSEGDPNKLIRYQQTVIRISSLLREVIYKVQTLINYYILHSRDSLTNNIFEQNFWYTICRLVYGNVTIDHVQNKYPRFANITAVFDDFQNLENVNLLVEKEDLVGYGHIISTACETMTTSYSNFYVENYKNYLARYFTYRINVIYKNLGMTATKKLVNGYIIDEVLINHERTNIPENLIDPEDIAAAPGLQNILNTLIQPIKNQLPHVSK